MTTGWGEAYFDHFERYFRSPDRVEVYRSEDHPTVQVLEYDRVFEGCRVFATVGVSHFAKQLGGPAEVVVPVDGGYEAVSLLLGTAPVSLSHNRQPLARGSVLAGIEEVSPGFVRAFGKDALYFTEPYGLPEEFGLVCHEGMHGRVYFGIFISRRELAVLDRVGAAEFETRFQGAHADPFALGRPSAF